MGWSKFRIWDFDLVEDYNLPNQAFFPCDIGMLKIDALERLLKEFNPDITVEKFPVPFTSEKHKMELMGPLVIATDSMKSRADITKAFSYNDSISAVLEARLGFDYGEIHVVDPIDAAIVTAWKGTLKRDEDIPDGPCNLRICPTLVGLVSSTLVHYLCAPYALQRAGVGTAALPFMTRFLMKDALITRTVKLRNEVAVS
jgi:molybdopterin/thiamine biosynthesis adenylyltransferase